MICCAMLLERKCRIGTNISQTLGGLGGCSKHKLDAVGAVADLTVWQLNVTNSITINNNH